MQKTHQTRQLPHHHIHSWPWQQLERGLVRWAPRMRSCRSELGRRRRQQRRPVPGQRLQSTANSGMVRWCPNPITQSQGVVQTDSSSSGCVNHIITLQQTHYHAAAESVGSVSAHAATARTRLLLHASPPLAASAMAWATVWAWPLLLAVEMA